MKINSLIASGALVGLMFSGHAVGAVVNFDGMVTTGTCITTQIDASGLSFNTGFYQCLRNTATGTDGRSDNGTDFLINGFSNLTVTATNGNQFNLTGLDLGISYYNANASDNVTLTAFYHGGGSSAQVLSIGQNFANYALSFNGLDSFSISAPSFGNGYIAIDNISYSQDGNSVPEPGSLALLGLGLLGLARARKGSAK